jgi:hypothetical protein
MKILEVIIFIGVVQCKQKEYRDKKHKSGKKVGKGVIKDQIVTDYY